MKKLIILSVVLAMCSCKQNAETKTQEVEVEKTESGRSLKQVIAVFFGEFMNLQNTEKLMKQVQKYKY